jgi:hypothetical protein
VGIGTDNPLVQLDIQNTDHAVMRLLAGTNKSASMRLRNDAQDWDVNLQTNDNFAIYDQTGGANALTIAPSTYDATFSGDVTISTSAAKLTVFDASAGQRESIVIDRNTSVDNDYQEIRWKLQGNSYPGGYIRHEYEDVNNSTLVFGTRQSGTPTNAMKIFEDGDVLIGNASNRAGFTPSLTIVGSNPCIGLRAQDSNSGTFFNTILASDGNSIRAFYSVEYRFATAANDGGTSENTRFALDTSGNVSIDGNLTEGSDIRLKTNIEKIPDVLDVLDKIKPVKFEWKEDVEEGIEKKRIGLIAQEVEPHFPELIYEGTTRDTEETTYKGLNYAGLTPILLKAVQELSEKNDALEKRIEELEK